MKKILHLFSIFFLLPFVYSWGQSPIILDSNGNNITNSSITISGSSAEEVIKNVFFVRNPGMRDIAVSMRKVDVDVVRGTDNGFMFAGRFNPSPISSAQGRLIIRPNETTYPNECYLQIAPNGKTGESTFRLEFYSEERIFQPVFVQVTFSKTQSSNFSGTPFASSFFSEAYPNPARGHTTIDYQLTPDVKSGRVVIRSLTGQVVQSTPLNLGANSVRIDTSSLNPGMYFYSVELNNQVFVSKRLIVGR